MIIKSKNKKQKNEVSGSDKEFNVQRIGQPYQDLDSLCYIANNTGHKSLTENYVSLHKAQWSMRICRFRPYFVENET